MRRARQIVVVVGVLLARAPAAHADSPAPAPAPAPAFAPTPTPTPAPIGVAVVALPGAADAAWPLAGSVYADPSLRPTAVDEPHARVLCGEPPATPAPADLRDLSDTVAALRGDDAPSRALLDGIARRFSVRAILVVRSDAGGPTARLFLSETGAFDAATYAPDSPPPAPSPSGPRQQARWTAFSAPVRPPPLLHPPLWAFRPSPRARLPEKRPRGRCPTSTNPGGSGAPSGPRR